MQGDLAEVASHSQSQVGASFAQTNLTGCPTYVKLTCTSKMIWNSLQNNAQNNVATPTCEIAGPVTCPKVRMDGMTNRATGDKMNACCCARSAKQPSMYRKTSDYPGNGPFSDEGEKISGFDLRGLPNNHELNPCATSPSTVSKNLECSGWVNGNPRC